MRVAIPPGTPLGDVRRRMVGRGFWTPTNTQDGVDATTSSRPLTTAVAHAATPHTKGAWVQVIAATAADAHVINLTLNTNTSAAATDTSTLLDIGIGGAGAEVALVSNLGVGYAAGGSHWEIPVLVPSGSRVAIRAQGAVLSQSVAVLLWLSTLPFGRRPGNHLVTMGADTATSKGVTLTAGAANTKGAWTEIVASTAEPFGTLIVAAQGAADTILLSAGELLDIGVGTAGNETAIMSNLGFATTTGEAITQRSDMTFPADVPMGTRLSARYASGTGNSMDVILIGAPRQ